MGLVRVPRLFFSGFMGEFVKQPGVGQKQTSAVADIVHKLALRNRGAQTASCD
jgi:hypothetical protein